MKRYDTRRDGREELGADSGLCVLPVELVVEMHAQAPVHVHTSRTEQQQQQQAKFVPAWTGSKGQAATVDGSNGGKWREDGKPKTTR